LPPAVFSVAGRPQPGRQDLTGSRCDCLIPAQPPKETIEARGRRASATAGDHCHAVGNPAKGEPPGQRGLPKHGYRPRRKTALRQEKNRKR
jgi:hypothetical protein